MVNPAKVGSSSGTQAGGSKSPVTLDALKSHCAQKLGVSPDALDGDETLKILKALLEALERAAVPQLTIGEPDLQRLRKAHALDQFNPGEPPTGFEAGKAQIPNAAKSFLVTTPDRTFKLAGSVDEKHLLHRLVSSVGLNPQSLSPAAAGVIRNAIGKNLTNKDNWEKMARALKKVALDEGHLGAPASAPSADASRSSAARAAHSATAAAPTRGPERVALQRSASVPRNLARALGGEPSTRAPSPTPAGGSIRSPFSLRAQEMGSAVNEVALATELAHEIGGGEERRNEIQALLTRARTKDGRLDLEALGSAAREKILANEDHPNHANAQVGRLASSLMKMSTAGRRPVVSPSEAEQEMHLGMAAASLACLGEGGEPLTRKLMSILEKRELGRGREASTSRGAASQKGVHAAPGATPPTRPSSGTGAQASAATPRGATNTTPGAAPTQPAPKGAPVTGASRVAPSRASSRAGEDDAAQVAEKLVDTLLPGGTQPERDQLRQTLQGHVTAAITPEGFDRAQLTHHILDALIADKSHFHSTQAQNLKTTLQAAQQMGPNVAERIAHDAAGAVIGMLTADGQSKVGDINNYLGTLRTRPLQAPPPPPGGPAPGAAVAPITVGMLPAELTAKYSPEMLERACEAAAGFGVGKDASHGADVVRELADVFSRSWRASGPAGPGGPEPHRVVQNSLRKLVDQGLVPPTELQQFMDFANAATQRLQGAQAALQGIAAEQAQLQQTLAAHGGANPTADQRAHPERQNAEARLQQLAQHQQMYTQQAMNEQQSLHALMNKALTPLVLYASDPVNYAEQVKKMNEAAQGAQVPNANPEVDPIKDSIRFQRAMNCAAILSDKSLSVEDMIFLFMMWFVAGTDRERELKMQQIVELDQRDSGFRAQREAVQKELNKNGEELKNISEEVKNTQKQIELGEGIKTGVDLTPQRNRLEELKVKESMLTRTQNDLKVQNEKLGADLDRAPQSRELKFMELRYLDQTRENIINMVRSMLEEMGRNVQQIWRQ